MRSYDRNNPDGYPSQNRSKQKRHSFRENQYEGSSNPSDQIYTSMRGQIKRHKGLLESYRKRKMLRTSFARKIKKAKKIKGYKFQKHPKNTIKDNFFKLFKCNLYSINTCFDGNDTVYFSLGNIDDSYLKVDISALPHLLGLDRELLADSTPLWKYGCFEEWKTLSILERLQQILANKKQIKEYEKHNGVDINYTKAREKNKSMFLFDLFNLNKSQTYAKKMSQEEVDTIYASYYGKKQNQNQDQTQSQSEYIILERKKGYDKKNRYITIIFKKIQSTSSIGEYIPISIIETFEPKISQKEANSTTIKKIPPIRILDATKGGINKGITHEDTIIYLFHKNVLTKEKNNKGVNK